MGVAIRNYIIVPLLHTDPLTLRISIHTKSKRGQKKQKLFNPKERGRVKLHLCGKVLILCNNTSATERCPCCIPATSTVNWAQVACHTFDLLIVLYVHTCVGTEDIHCVKQCLQPDCFTVSPQSVSKATCECVYYPQLVVMTSSIYQSLTHVTLHPCMHKGE